MALKGGIMRFNRYVIAYDIADAKRRKNVYDLLKGMGDRVNLSVFECEVKKGGITGVRKKIKGMINPNEDVVVYYPLCLNCRAQSFSEGRKIFKGLDEVVFSI